MIDKADKILIGGKMAFCFLGGGYKSRIRTESQSKAFKKWHPTQVVLI
mgnify:CR=1 FL=1